MFLVVQKRAAAPTLELSLFRVPAFTGAVSAVFMSRVLTIGGTVYFVQYFQGALHLSPTATGLMLVPGAVAQMAAGMLAGRLQARFPPGPIVASGYACKAVAAAWLAFAMSPSAHPAALAVPLSIWGFGGGIGGTPVMSVAMNVVDKRHVGMVGGTVTTLAAIGGGIGTAVLGVLYTARTDGAGDTEEAIASGASAVLYASAALAVVTLVLALVLISPRHVPGR